MLFSCAWADLLVLPSGWELEEALQLLCPSSALFSHLYKGLAENWQGISEGFAVQCAVWTSVLNVL